MTEQLPEETKPLPDMASQHEVQPPPDSSARQDVEARLRVLEERTQPKPKALIEKIGAWSGVATFALAVLYSFPLGVWDRFVVSPQNEQKMLLNEQRTLISKLNDVDADYYKLSQTMPKDQLFINGMVATTKKRALLADTNASRAQGLSPVELFVLGYHLFSAGQNDEALLLFDLAWNKDGKDGPKNPFVKAELQRMRGGSLFEKDPSSARKLLRDAVLAYRTISAGTPMPAMAAWDWVGTEYNNSRGDRACANLLAKWAIEELRQVDAMRAEEWASRVPPNMPPEHSPGECRLEEVHAAVAPLALGKK